MDWTKTLPFRELTREEQDEIKSELNKMTAQVQSCYGGSIVRFIENYHVIDSDEEHER